MHVFLRTTPATMVPVPNRDGLVLDLFAEPSRSTIATNIQRVIEHVGQPTQPGIDFLLMSMGVFAADKKTPRRQAPDRWTRTFNLSAPVTNVVAWATAEQHLKEAVSFLTGDHWAMEWRVEQNQLWRVRRVGKARYDAVCLFSGGLDSLVGAIDLLEAPGRPRVALIGHHDSTLTPKIQSLLADALVSHYGADRVHLFKLGVRPAECRDGQEYPLPSARESTTRSRSIVFLGLGLAVASALGSDIPLYVPENGFIALNVPLIPARLGSCSTRTTHPYFLENLRQALKAIGLPHPIVNPYELVTKGEMLKNCRHQSLLRQLAPYSVSCAHPELGRYEHSGYGNCGYCFPCLIRRASMNTMGSDAAKEYGRDVCTDVSVAGGRGLRGRDVRAVFAALQRGPGRREDLLPLLSGPLPAGYTLANSNRVRTVGMAELRDLFVTKANPAVAAIAGL